jgi:hypothetical protein|tara:strand:+ start:935 stop:1246 length:312 start_codon:yes stop_codon:yes gene_type:complete
MGIFLHPFQIFKKVQDALVLSTLEHLLVGIFAWADRRQGLLARAVYFAHHLSEDNIPSRLKSHLKNMVLVLWGNHLGITPPSLRLEFLSIREHRNSVACQACI